MGGARGVDKIGFKVLLYFITVVRIVFDLFTVAVVLGVSILKV
jgi:hypothetical protein